MALAARFVDGADRLSSPCSPACCSAATFVGVRYILRQIELVQAKSSFVSNVTHELKTPIAVIKLAVETIEMGRFRSDEERDKYLRTIQRESDKLAQLVDNILDFARLESGQHALRLGPVDVHDVISTALESFRLRLEDEGFKWQVDCPEAAARCSRRTPLALQHCLLNLLDNAVKYSGERKEITDHRPAAGRMGEHRGLGPRHRHRAGGPGAHLREVRRGSRPGWCTP